MAHALESNAGSDVRLQFTHSMRRRYSRHAERGRLAGRNDPVGGCPVPGSDFAGVGKTQWRKVRAEHARDFYGMPYHEGAEFLRQQDDNLPALP